jgi:PAS fold
VLTNPAYHQLIGHRDVVGLPVREAVPEVAGQGLFELLDNVFTTGEPFVGKDVKIVLQRTPGGIQETRYLDFVYQPIKDESGNVMSIFVEGLDVTERRATEQALRELNANLERRVIERAQASSAALRASALTHRLLAFGRRQSLDTRPNDGWWGHLQQSRDSLTRMPLAAIAVDEPDTLETYLTECARSRQPHIGSLILQRADGVAIKFRAGGALFRSDATPKSRVVLLRLVPAPESGIAFTALNDKIRQLNAEIARRRLIEEDLRRERELLQVKSKSVCAGGCDSPRAGVCEFAEQQRQILAARLRNLNQDSLRGAPCVSKAASAKASG